MSTLTEIIQEIVRLGRVTPTLEKEINALLWSTELDTMEMIALQELELLLANGTILVE
jgi:hypothetical protein